MMPFLFHAVILDKAYYKGRPEVNLRFLGWFMLCIILESFQVNLHLLGWF